MVICKLTKQVMRNVSVEMKFLIAGGWLSSAAKVVPAELLRVGPEYDFLVCLLGVWRRLYRRCDVRSL